MKDTEQLKKVTACPRPRLASKLKLLSCSEVVHVRCSPAVGQISRLPVSDPERVDGRWKPRLRDTQHSHKSTLTHKKTRVLIHYHS